MRWYWIDRFVEFTSGISASAIKNVSLAEEHLHDHFSDFPVMPMPLVIEGIAQTGGLLACEKSGFTNKVVLAKVPKGTFHREARPGDTLTYTTRLLDWNTNGSVIEATARIGDEPIAELEMFFAHLQEEFLDGRQLFGANDLLRLFRVFGGYQVGRTADGQPLRDPGLPRNSDENFG